MERKILLSAFACDPTKGSEPGNGWNWSSGLAKRGNHVYCFTRIIGKADIEKQNIYPNLKFHYLVLPYGLEKLYKFSTVGMYIYYILWQWFAYRKAKHLHQEAKFDMAHHVSWGSTQMGSFMYKLDIPFIFGPAGGGQNAPTSFKHYFGKHWKSEERRSKISKFLLEFNPGCKKMLKKAYRVLVSNPETEIMVREAGGSNVYSTLDAALPQTFFPQMPIYKRPKVNSLNLLWVGRFMPRKGISLVLDVMKQLKEYPGINLTVVGDGELKDEFLKKIKEFSLEKTVFWKGLVPYSEVKNFYSSQDAFIFTSLRDSCPAQLIEAMAYTMPVITIDLHGQAVIVNDDTGYKCKCSTPEEAISELCKAVLLFYENPDLVNQKSLNAYKFAEMQTWDNKIDHIINNYYPKNA